MAIFGSIKKIVNKPSPLQPTVPVQPESEPEPEPIAVSEIESSELIARCRSAAAPRLLDCREPFEWAQVRIPGSLHIPMNDIPARLEELDREAEWVVVCAHGNRSVAVAGYLLHHGLRASSLAGGVTDWWMRGGETESDYRR
jgi:rhodanese-related sulfurtransferase